MAVASFAYADPALSAFELDFVEGGERCRPALGQVWNRRFESVDPVREFRWAKGGQGFAGSYFSATVGDHAGYESWLERDRPILLDREPVVVIRVRDHRVEGRPWIEATWKHLHRAPVPFGELAWDRARHPGRGERIPVVYITVPPAATPRMLAAEFARFLGLPITRSANITEAVVGVCTDTRTGLVLVDELHNISLYFSERVPATFVHAGIDIERSNLLPGTRGAQSGTLTRCHPRHRRSPRRRRPRRAVARGTGLGRAVKTGPLGACTPSRSYCRPPRAANQDAIEDDVRQGSPALGCVCRP
ncbi:hypothetical protein AB0C76_03365 [Kitasatospora sp. NPDC048722]|uniref:hypothetical protein n=1 Tax=Kitasatospora sp. NPDC048722 TaxID=3155639 RepID=UPI0033F44E7B